MSPTFFLALLLWFSRYVFFTLKECQSLLFSGLLEHVSLSHSGLEVQAKQIRHVACLRLICSATFSFRYCFPWNPVSSTSRISSKLKWSWVMSLYSWWNKKRSQCDCHILICLNEWRNLYGNINWTWLWHPGENKIFHSCFPPMVKSITSELFLNLTHLLKTLSSSLSTWQSMTSSLCCMCENAFSLGESFIERSSKDPLVFAEMLMYGSYPCYRLYLTKTRPLWASARFYLHSTIR